MCTNLTGDTPYIFEFFYLFVCLLFRLHCRRINQVSTNSVVYVTIEPVICIYLLLYTNNLTNKMNNSFNPVNFAYFSNNTTLYYFSKWCIMYSIMYYTYALHMYVNYARDLRHS